MVDKLETCLLVFDRSIREKVTCEIWSVFNDFQGPHTSGNGVFCGTS